jgi:hypothetical protein
MLQHPDHLSLLAEERRALAARVAAERAALRAHRSAKPGRDLWAHLVHARRLLGHRPRLTRPAPVDAPLADRT